MDGTDSFGQYSSAIATDASHPPPLYGCSLATARHQDESHQEFISEARFGSGSEHKRVGENIWRSNNKITIERNPWDKVFSMYYFDNNNQNIPFKDYVLNCNGYKASDYDLYCTHGVPAAGYNHDVRDP